jgi:hypothetical protein
VESGLLERRLYSDRPRRFEYVLTERGRDFRPVLWSLVAWGNKHLAPDGPSLVIVDPQTGVWADPVLVDRQSGRELAMPDFLPVAGPAANAGMRGRYSLSSQQSGAPLQTSAESHVGATLSGAIAP